MTCETMATTWQTMQSVTTTTTMTVTARLEYRCWRMAAAAVSDSADGVEAVVVGVLTPGRLLLLVEDI